MVVNPGDTKRISRRSFTRFVAVAAGAAALTPLAAACGSPAPTASPAASSKAAETPKPSGSGSEYVSKAQSSAAQPAAAAGTTEVRMYTWTAAANLPTWTKAIEAFQQKYPKVSVKLEHTPGQQYWDKLTVSYAGGTAPDVIYASPPDGQRVATQGMVTDLAQRIKDEKVNIEDISPSAQRPYMWAGKIWGIAAWMDTRYTIYNKTLFKEAGLPELPQTWDGEFTIDQFLEYAKKLTDPNKQTWGYVFEGNGLAARFSWLFGADYYDSLDYPTKAVMDSPEGQEGFQFVQDMVHKYKIAPSTAENMGGSDPMFQTGKVGMIWGGFKSSAAVHQVIKNFEWGISTVPKGKVRMSNVSPQAFQVISKTKIPDEAWLLTKYVTADEGNVIMCSKVSMPANKNIEFSKISPLEPWQNKLLQDGLKSGRPEVPHPNVKPQFGTIINEEMDQLMAKTKSGAEVAKAIASRINAAFQPYVVPK